MKTNALILLLSVFLLSKYSSAQVPTYDSVLAKKLHADDYGMKQYVLVILKAGTANTTDKKTRDSIFQGHMANIKRLAAENKLVIAGPTGDNERNYEGIFVFNTGNLDEAKQWLNTDPAVQSKYLDAETYLWYGSAALQEIPELHQKIQKTSF